MRAFLGALLVGSLAIAPIAEAQPDASRAPAIVLRPDAELAALAADVARVLSRRGVDRFEVGEPPPPGVPEAVLTNHLAIVKQDPAIRLVYAGSGGAIFATELELGRSNRAASVRAIALAIESLVDTAREPPPASASGEGRTRVRTRVLPAELGDAGEWRRPEILPIAKPTIFLRVLAGVSPLRGTPLIGPGAGLGLCVTVHCVVIEGDLSLIPERRLAPDGKHVRYRSVNASVRLQIRPFDFRVLIPGVTLGFVTRIGNAWVEGTDDERTVTNLGVRGTAELAWRFARRFEAVLEAGVDLAISRAEFIRYSASVFLEDRWTPWIVTSMRLRP